MSVVRRSHRTPARCCSVPAVLLGTLAIPRGAAAAASDARPHDAAAAHGHRFSLTDLGVWAVRTAGPTP